MRQQPVSAAPAYPCCEWDRAGAGLHGVGRRLGADGEFADAGYVACRQWSIGVRDRATLVRHFIDGVAQRTPPLAPARAARGMLELTAATALVALCSLPPSFTPTHARAHPAAILLTAVAVRTQQHLIATTRAQEQAGRSVHVHPRALPKVLDGLVPGCNTAAAPPSSARCRARRGTKLPGISNRCRAHLLRHRRRCTPPALAHVTGRAAVAAPTGRHLPGIKPSSMRSPSPAWPPSGGQAGEPHARSFGISRPRLPATSPNSKPPPRRQLAAGPERRSQHLQVHRLE